MSESSAGPEVCLLNIGPRQRALRLRFGAVSLAVALVASAGLVAAAVPAWWRLVTFLPFAAATVGFFQARRKT